MYPNSQGQLNQQRRFRVDRSTIFSSDGSVHRANPSNHSLSETGLPPPYSAHIQTDRSDIQQTYSSSERAHDSNIRAQRQSQPSDSTNYITHVNETTLLLPRHGENPRRSSSCGCPILFAFVILFLVLTLSFIGVGRSQKLFPSPHWINLTPSSTCASPGARWYTATSSNVPEGFHPDAPCYNMAIWIHGRHVDHPQKCHHEPEVREVLTPEGERQNVTFTRTRAEWLVDWGEESCLPVWELKADERCLSYGTLGYNGTIALDQVPPGLHPLDSCRVSPSVHGSSLAPTECHIEGKAVRARFLAESEPSCSTAYWVGVRGDDRCEAFGLKRYTATLKGIPDGLNGTDVCRQVKNVFFWEKAKAAAPRECWRDQEGNVIGSWMLDYHVPECHPQLRDIKDLDCSSSRPNARRVEARLDDIGEHDDWYKICTTTPLYRHGVQYLPVQCETRPFWFAHLRYALYDVDDLSCR